MDHTTDTLRTHLDALCEADGSPTGGAAEAAPAVFLSRSRFDHVVRDAMGESAGVFRRRVLLERAAYALLRTDATVLDVSVSAGFGSQEGFTRAFATAYGDAPGRWRRAHRDDPGHHRSFELGAPSGVHFQPPRGLRFPQNKEMNTMDLIIGMIRHHTDVIDALLRKLAPLDADVLDRPLDMDVEWVDAQPFSLRALADGLVTEEERYVFAVDGGTLPPHRDTTIAGLTTRQAIAGPALVGFVEDVVAAGRMGDTYVMADCPEDGERSYGGTIAHLVTFGAVRRTMAVRAYAALTGDESLGWADPAPVLDHA